MGTPRDDGFDLVIEGLRKTFPANNVTALDDVSARLCSGAVHAVVGENGAGKSTLMHVVAGLYAPDSGRAWLGGVQLPLGSTGRAIDAGVHMVYQYPQIVEDFALWEHLELAESGAIVSPAMSRARARALLSRYDISIDVDTPMSMLNPSQVYMVGIAVAAAGGPRVLILDEPTVGCTDREVEAIFSLMERLARLPAVVVLVTHKLRDVFRVARTALVMRRGRVVAHTNVSETDMVTLSRLILGKDRTGRPAESPFRPTTLAGTTPTDRAVNAARGYGAGGRLHGDRGEKAPLDRSALPAIRRSNPRLSVRGASVYHQGRQVVSELSFDVYGGEILGMVGIRENGLAWVEEVVSGMRVPDEGSIELLGRHVAGSPPSHLRRLGLAYVPTDRLKRGASLQSTVSENLLLTRRGGMHRYGVLHQERITDYASSRKAEFRIQGDLSDPLFRLSGGNIQKVILSRELSSNPDVLIFAEPSWGLDLATRQDLFERLAEMRDSGTAVLLISTDLDDVLELADRIAVVRDGTIVGALPAAEADRTVIGNLMLGVEPA